MSSKIIIAIMGTFFLGGVTWYLVSDSGSDATSTTNVEETSEVDTSQTVAEEKSTGSGSLFALMGKKGSMKCTFSSDEGGIHSEGTFYFDYPNERFRVDSESVIDGAPITSHVVNDGTRIYTWGNGMAVGMITDVKMMDLSEESFGQYEGEHVDETSMNLDENVQYDCDGWGVQESVFVPDTDIEFMDTSDLVEEMKDGFPEGFDIDAYSDLQVN